MEVIKKIIFWMVFSFGVTAILVGLALITAGELFESIDKYLNEGINEKLVFGGLCAITIGGTLLLSIVFYKIIEIMNTIIKKFTDEEQYIK